MSKKDKLNFAGRMVDFVPEFERKVHADDLKADAHGVFTGAIVTLLPSEEDSARLALEGYEPPDSLHMTISWLGDTAEDPNPELTFDEACGRIRGIDLAAIEAPAFAYAVFNPNDAERSPATVLLCQHEDLLALREAVVAVVGDASEHPCWFPHVTLGYDVENPNEAESRVGTILFDRIAVSYGSEQREVIDLAGTTIEASADPRRLPGLIVIKDLQGSKLPLLEVTSARIRAATVVDIPAFPEAKIELTGEPDADGKAPWTGPIAYVNLETGDQRIFYELTWYGPPLPLRWAQEDEGWHFGAEVVGTIDSFTMDGDAVIGTGTIDTIVPPGLALYTLMQRGLAGGVSVDLDEFDVKDEELVDAGSDDEEGPPDEVDLELILASIIGDTTLPIAGRDVAWDGSGSTGRVFDMCTSDSGTVDAACVSRAFLYRDPDADPTTQGAYKLGFADVISGQLQIVPAGVFACAGGRGVDAADIPTDEKDKIKSSICTLYGKLADKFNDDSIVCPFESGAASETIEASAWAEMQEFPPLPSKFFDEPVDLPQDKGAHFYDSGRIYGWVARRNVPHEVLGKTPPLENVDLTTFLRHEMQLDTGDTVRVGAYTMNVGHLHDGAECEDGACQFDDTRTVAGIVTVGVNEGGMWFSGIAAPWLSEWDRRVFASCQPSGHWRYEKGRWSLRAVLTVPVPGYPTPLAASAVVHRSNTALRANPAEEQAATLNVKFDEGQIQEITAGVINELERRNERDELRMQVRKTEIERMKEKVHG